MVDKNLPLKFKKFRGNQATFMTKELSKCVMTRSKARNKYLKWPYRETLLAYKKAKSLCNVLLRKAVKQHFQKSGSNEPVTIIDFGIQSNPFLHWREHSNLAKI